jgi:DNA-directed RNA polymerase subunit RPC12/RpoP
MPLIGVGCEQCGSELELLNEGEVTDTADLRTVQCTECGWQIEAERVPREELFGPELDWVLCSVRHDFASNEHRVIFDVRDDVNRHVVARCHTDGEFKGWEPSEPEVDVQFLRGRAIKTARCFEDARWSP